MKSKGPRKHSLSDANNGKLSSELLAQTIGGFPTEWSLIVPLKKKE